MPATRPIILVRAILDAIQHGDTILIGYEPDMRMFAGFDRKSNDEIAVCFRPDQFLTYTYNAQQLHRYGRRSEVLTLLERAATLAVVTHSELANLSDERRRIVHTVSRLSRLANFRLHVLQAYGHRCAVSRVQLRLVDAAHILPIGAPGSIDDVRNGFALAPTYHRAFDNGPIVV